MLPGHDIRYIRMEKVIMEYLDLVFDQYEVSDPNYICVTRNADVSPDDEALDITDDFRKLMQSTLHKRRRMAVVRLETAEKLTPEMQEYFCKKFKITGADLPHEDADETGLYVLHRRKSPGVYEESTGLRTIFPAKISTCTGRKHVKTGEKE